MSSKPIVARDAHRRPHGPRSKNGCLTCKRRKVRCNELRPRCFHCTRLNLQCVWKDTEPHPQVPLENVDADPFKSNVEALEANKLSPPSQFFEFAPSMVAPTANFPLFQNVYFPDFGDFTASGPTFYERAPSADRNSPSSTIAPRQYSPQSPIAKTDVESALNLHLPPILDPVENGPRCASARELLESMATSSPMLRSSIAAFEAIQAGGTGGNMEYEQYYDNAATELTQRFDESTGQTIVSSNDLRYVLATIFFLTYINVGQIDGALMMHQSWLTLDLAPHLPIGFSLPESCHGA